MAAILIIFDKKGEKKKKMTHGNNIYEKKGNWNFNTISFFFFLF